MSTNDMYNIKGKPKHLIQDEYIKSTSLSSALIKYRPKKSHKSTIVSDV